MKHPLGDRQPGEHMPQPKHKRPFGVIVIAFLLLLNGMLATARGAGIAYQFYEEQNGQLEPDKISERAEDLTLIEWLTLPMTAAGIVIAWGMWTLRPAAWLATMTLQGLYLAAHLYDYSQGRNIYPQLLVTVLTVFYLNQRDVKLVFRTRGTTARRGSSS
jgi:hypothetical protein